MLVLAPFLLCFAMEAPPVFDGSKLASVPGPQPPHGPDLAVGPGASSVQIGIRARARHSGSLSAVAVPAIPSVVEDRVEMSSGWKAYLVEAPVGATVKARLRSDHEGWFRVSTANRWGNLEQGMLQNRIHTGNPEASYINPKNGTATFYFIVDTTDISADTETFRLEISLGSAASIPKK